MAEIFENGGIRLDMREELAQIREGVEQAAEAAELIVADELQMAMNRYNQSKKAKKKQAETEVE